MGRCRALLLTAACAMGAAVSGGAVRADPLRSPACLEALDALRAREAIAVQTPSNSPDPRLLALRRRAAAVCLGVRDDAAPVPARQSQTPVSTLDATRAPAVIAAPPELRPLVPNRPVVAPAPPLTTLNCDAVGCTASDGSRLNRMGPDLWGPGGPCIALGPVLQCP